MGPVSSQGSFFGDRESRKFGVREGEVIAEVEVREKEAKASLTLTMEEEPQAKGCRWPLDTGKHNGAILTQDL